MKPNYLKTAALFLFSMLLIFSSSCDKPAADTSSGKAQTATVSSSEQKPEPDSKPQNTSSVGSKDDVSDNSAYSDAPQPSASTSGSDTDINEPQAPYAPVTEIIRTYDTGDLTVNADFGREIFYDEISGKSMPYRLHIPDNFSPDKQYPVILFLHGAGEIGSDNEIQLPHFSQSFGAAGDILKYAVIVCPQTPAGWNIDEYEAFDRRGWLSIAKRILDRAVKDYNGDRDRIYLTGLSLGSFAVWELLENYPGFFAAAVPVCGGAGWYASENLISTPIWIFHGTADYTVSFSSSYETYLTITDAGGIRVRFTELPGVGHNAWDYAYTSREMFSWMFSQDLSSCQSADYDYVSVFEIRAADGGALITEKNAADILYTIESDSQYIEFYLDERASVLLQDEYKRNSGAVYSVYYLGNPVYDFRLSGSPENGVLRLERPDGSDSFDVIYSFLSDYVRNSMI